MLVPGFYKAMVPQVRLCNCVCPRVCVCVCVCVGVLSVCLRAQVLGKVVPSSDEARYRWHTVPSPLLPSPHSSPHSSPPLPSLACLFSLSSPLSSLLSSLRFSSPLLSSPLPS